MQKDCWPDFKRLMEYYHADPLFREFFQKNPKDALEEKELCLDWQKAQEALTVYYRQGGNLESYVENPYCMAYYQRLLYLDRIIRERVRSELFASRQMCSWNKIVTRRIHMENYMLRMHKNIFYYPVSFELGEGCTVQCPFCGVSAKKWRSNYSYDEKSSSFWREILKKTQEVIGQIAKTAICYFGTEPLDNPDYEKFLLDFRKIMGEYPQTTTAMADKDPKRIRSLIQMIGKEEMRGAAVRFSIRTKKQFERIMELYTAEELSEIELLFNNLESDCKYSNSGRVRLQNYPEEKLNHRYSISCIAGFLVNLCKKTITFMEPEIPDEQHPEGIHIYETVSFETVQQYGEALGKMIEKWAHIHLSSMWNLKLNSYCKVEKIQENMLEFKGDHIVCKMSGNHHFLEAIALLQKKQVLSFEDIKRILGMESVVAESVWQKFNLLYQKGYLRRQV